MTRTNAQPQLVVRPASGGDFGLYLKVRGRLVELLVASSYGECLSGARGVAAYCAAMTLDPVISTEGL